MPGAPPFPNTNQPLSNPTAQQHLLFRLPRISHHNSRTPNTDNQTTMAVEEGADKQPSPAPTDAEAAPAPSAATTPDAAEAAAATATTAAATDAAAGQGQAEEGEAEPPVEVNIQVELPTGVVLTLPNVHKGEVGLWLKQALSEYPEACFYTSYSLVFKGAEPRLEVNDFVELSEYPETLLYEGVQLQMVLEDYDIRRVRQHVRRFKELLMYPPVISPTTAPATTAPVSTEAGGATAITSTSTSTPTEAEEKNGGEKEMTKKEVEDMLNRLPKVDLPIKVSLDKLYPTVLGPSAAPAKEFQVPTCLQSLNYSGWNPPPAGRKLLGDLLYLEVRTLDDTVLHVTATPGGFYVNKTHGDKFDPTPAAHAHFAHELITMLGSAWPSFKKAWQHAVQATTEHAQMDNPMENLAVNIGEGKIEAVLPSKTPWLIPAPFAPPSAGGSGAALESVELSRHKYDEGRCEDDLVDSFGMDERGALRDWNEDYQSAREMPAVSVGDKLVRAKILHKVLTDFGEAAVAGATAVVQGFVTPINPNEVRRNHVYVYNNIFFSYAVDTQNTFKVIEGDGPAFKNALHEVRNIKSLNRLLAAAAEEEATSKHPRLYTLATSVIDYLGVRVVAQSIIPGILSGDQQSRLMYGSVEPGVKLQAKKEMHDLLLEASKTFFLAERDLPVLPIKPKEGQLEALAAAEAERKKAGLPTIKVDDDEEGEGGEPATTVKFVGPVEWKGIKGADGRCYMLDLVRLTPRDPNWIKENWKDTAGSGTGMWERAAPMEGVPPLEDDMGVVLRPELVHLYIRKRIGTLREKIVGEYRAKKKAKAEAAAAETKEGKEEKDGGEEKKKEGEEENEEEEEDVDLDQATVTQLKEEEEELLERLKINPNAFLPLDGIEDLDQLAKDEEQIRVLGRFLWHDLLPAFLDGARTGRMNPLDGETLTDNLHQSGINVRYLGRLTALAKESAAAEAKAGPNTNPNASVEEKRYRTPEYFIQLCETEMVARAVKHVVFDLLKERPDLRSCPAPTIVAVLNAVLGKVEVGNPTTTTAKGGSASPTGAAQKKKKNNKKKGGAAAAAGNGVAPDAPEEEEDAVLTPPTSPGGTGGGGGGGGGKGKKSSKNKKKGGGGGGHAAGMNGSASPSSAAVEAAAAAAKLQAAFFATSADEAPRPVPSADVSLETLRARVLADIRQRYRYSSPTLLRTEALPNPYAVLRRISQKLGLKIYARAFDFEGAREPLSLRDLSDVQPVAKHSAPDVLLEEAKQLMENAKFFAQTGQVQKAYEYVTEATTLYTQIYGAVHVEVGKCFELQATIIFQVGEPDVGLTQLKKALAIFWQTTGFDSYEAINAHHTLALFLQSMRGRVDEAVFHFHACTYLIELVAGPHSPELPQQYLRLGTVYQELGRLQEAYQCHGLAYEKARHVPDTVQEALMAHHLAGLEAAFTLYKEALNHEKVSYGIFRHVLGESHPRVVESSNHMSQYTQQAVESTKRKSLSVANPAGTGGARAGGKKKGGNAAASPTATTTSTANASPPDDSWVAELEAAEAKAAGKKKNKGGGGKKK